MPQQQSACRLTREQCQQLDQEHQQQDAAVMQRFQLAKSLLQQEAEIVEKDPKAKPNLWEEAFLNGTIDGTVPTAPAG